MHEVVVRAVKNAVRAATNIFTATSIKRFFFIIGKVQEFKGSRVQGFKGSFLDSLREEIFQKSYSKSFKILFP